MRTWRSGLAVLGALVMVGAGCSKTPRPFATDVPAGNPVGVAVDNDGLVYYGGNPPFVGVRLINKDGRVELIAGPEPAKNSPIRKGARFIETIDVSNPSALAVLQDGTIFALDQISEKVVRIEPDDDLVVLVDPVVNDVTRPHAIAVDVDGNVYLSEPLDNRVRKIDPAGSSTTFAGRDGVQGSDGDGGPATEATLAAPTAITVDAAGNVYIGEREGKRIRRVDPSGIISTIAGTGEQGSAGDGGPATQAQFTDIRALAVDGAGNLYVVDGGANVVRKIDPGGTITAFAGTGVAGFDGDLGPATAAQLCGPSGIAIDANGRVFIADTFNDRIRRVSASGNISTIAGTRTAEGAECQLGG